MFEALIAMVGFLFRRNYGLAEYLTSFGGLPSPEQGSLDIDEQGRRRPSVGIRRPYFMARQFSGLTMTFVSPGTGLITSTTGVVDSITRTVG
jgi:hypothetical protein